MQNVCMHTILEPFKWGLFLRYALSYFDLLPPLSCLNWWWWGVQWYISKRIMGMTLKQHIVYPSVWYRYKKRKSTLIVTKPGRDGNGRAQRQQQQLQNKTRWKHFDWECIHSGMNTSWSRQIQYKTISIVFSSAIKYIYIHARTCPFVELNCLKYVRTPPFQFQKAISCRV